MEKLAHINQKVLYEDIYIAYLYMCQILYFMLKGYRSIN